MYLNYTTSYIERKSLLIMKLEFYVKFYQYNGNKISNFYILVSFRLKRLHFKPGRSKTGHDVRKRLDENDVHFGVPTDVPNIRTRDPDDYQSFRSVILLLDLIFVASVLRENIDYSDINLCL